MRGGNVPPLANLNRYKPRQEVQDLSLFSAPPLKGPRKHETFSSVLPGNAAPSMSAFASQA
jgi:hypothetical protein